jgi:NADP-dependent 3-hydroxy acid dehydrogenase YdfG
MGNCVLITGATSGIGEATARILSRNKFRLILTGRRLDRLEKLKDELMSESQAEIFLLNFDVREPEEVEKAVDSLKPPFDRIDILVNNAGLAVGLGALPDGILEDWDRMLDTNVKGLLYVTRKIARKMIGQQSGHIINISSVAGKEVYPNGNVYCASKHAVQALTKSLRLELLSHNIKVSSVAPGAVNTEFSLVRFKGDQQRADQVYKGFIPLQAADVAEVIYFMITRPPHVNIDDVLIMPTAQAFSRDFNRQ